MDYREINRLAAEEVKKTGRYLDLDGKYVITVKDVRQNPTCEGGYLVKYNSKHILLNREFESDMEVKTFLESFTPLADYANLIDDKIMAWQLVKDIIAKKYFS